MLTNHKCTLGLDADNTVFKQRGIRYKIAKYLRKLTQVSLDHPNTFDHYRSYSTVIAEQQRQIFERGNYVIHPLSQISLYWGSITSAINIIHMCVSTFRLSYIIDYPRSPRLDDVDYLMLTLHITSLLDIVVKFNTSFPERTPVNVVMDRRKIACRYIHFWFWMDLLSSVPWAFILLKNGFEKKRWLLLAHMLPIFKSLRLRSSVIHIHTLMKLFTRSYIWHRSIHHFILFAVTMHWSSCFIYTPVILKYYWTGHVPTGYNTFLPSEDITKCSIGAKYFKAFFVCLSSFFGTGFSTYKMNNPDEFVIHSLIILYTSMFMVYTVVYLLKIYMTKYNSTMRYHGLINQVEAYMQQKQFPRPLKKRVCTFYTYKYRGKYYKEDAALDCLSDQLRQEIVMHTCNKFIHEVKLLKDLPANVTGELMSYLKPETYLANDLVLRAGDIGDCMYFIAYGTVAVYSLKGAEVVHLEDGDYFGTVALLMKDSKRITTVVAVEISHLYRLDAPYFRKYLMSNKTIRERIEALASKRMHETVVLDEDFRREQEKKREENMLTNRDFSKINQ